MRKSFTIIELLIVISILILLFSLLNPTFIRIFHQAGVTECQNQIKQATMTTLLMSEDSEGILPKGGGSRSGGHAIWLRYGLVKRYVEYGLKRDYLICPTISKGEDEVVEVFGEKRVLIHNQYLGNNPALLSRTSKKSQKRNYKLARRNDQEGDRVLFADGNAYNSWEGGWTMAPHTDYDRRQWEGFPIEPQVFGSEGGNVGLLDGSVAWKDYSDLTVYKNSTGPDAHGLW